MRRFLCLVLMLSACRHTGPSSVLPARPARDPNGTDLVVQTGHHGPIDAMAFSPDGRWMATGGFDKSVVLWDLRTQRAFDNLYLEACVNVAAFSPDGSLVAVGTGDYRDGGAHLFEVRSGRLLGSLGDGGRKILALAFSPDGKMLAVGGVDQDGPELTIWSLPSRQRLRTFEGHTDAISALGFSGDGHTLVSGSWDLSVRSWSLDGGSSEELGPLGTDRARALTVAGPIVAFDRGGGQITVLSIESGSTLAPISGSAPLALSKDGSVLAHRSPATDSVEVEIHATTSGSRLGSIQNVSELPTPALAFSPDGQLLGTGAFGGAVRLFEAPSGRPLGVLSGKASYFMGISFLSGSREFVSLGGDGSLSLWNAERADRVHSVALPKPENGGWSLLSVVGTTGIAMDQAGLWAVFEVRNDRIESRVTSSKLEGVSSLALSPDARQFVVGTNRGELQRWDLQAGNLAESVRIDEGSSLYAVVVDPKNQWVAASVGKTVQFHGMGSESAPSPLDGNGEDVCSLAVSPDGTRIASGDFDGGIVTWSRDGSRLARWKAHDRKVRHLEWNAKGTHLLSTSDGESVVWDGATGMESFRLLGHLGGVPSGSFSPDGKVIVTAGWDGTLRLFGANRGEERARFMEMGDDDFVVATPKGEYRASRGGLRGVAFRSKDRVYPFEQFDLVYNRPDRVLESIGLAPEEWIRGQKALVESRRRRMGFSERPDMLLGAPELTITSNPPPVSTKEKTVEFDVSLEALNSGLDRLMVYADDVPIHGMKGLTLRDRGKSADVHVEVPLSNGANKIQLSVIDQGGVESLRETFVVRYDGPEAPRDLYVLAVGVSDYGKAESNLGYPVKDVKDILRVLGARSKAFREVKTTSLTDGRATREGVRQAAEFLKSSRVDDQVVVFIAGHGLLDARDRYVFATADTDFDRPYETGLSFEDLEALLDGIPAREKLLLMDTCHAGELGDEVEGEASAVNPEVHVKFRAIRPKGGKLAAPRPPAKGQAAAALEEWFADLRRGSGATVIAAAGGSEVAAESPSWDNGVFSFAVLEGLRELKADANRDGKVTVTELRNHVSRRVRDLTGGAQAPTARRENVERDFIVFE